MARGKWLTPNTPGSGHICRVLRIPDGEDFKAIVNGALLPLLSPYNFEAEGDLSPSDTAAYFQQMYDDWLNERGCMIGAIFPYMSANPPDNCLACDGTHYLKSDYPLLSAVLDSHFSVDSTHFATPDLRERVVLGAHSVPGGYTVGDTGGEKSHTLSQSEMPSHIHSYVQPINNVPSYATPGVLPLIVGAGAFTSSAGSDQPHNNLQPYIALNFAVVAR